MDVNPQGSSNIITIRITCISSFSRSSVSAWARPSKCNWALLSNQGRAGFERDIEHEGHFQPVVAVSAKGASRYRTCIPKFSELIQSGSILFRRPPFSLPFATSTPHPLPPTIRLRLDKFVLVDIPPSSCVFGYLSRTTGMGSRCFPGPWGRSCYRSSPFRGFPR